MQVIRALLAAIYMGSFSLLLHHALHQRSNSTCTDLSISSPGNAAMQTQLARALAKKPISSAQELFAHIAETVPIVQQLQTTWLPDGTLTAHVTVASPSTLINNTDALCLGRLVSPTLFASSVVVQLPQLSVKPQLLETAVLPNLAELITHIDQWVWDNFFIRLETANTITLTDKYNPGLTLHCTGSHIPDQSLCAAAQSVFHDLKQFCSFENPEIELSIDTRFSGRLIVSQTGRTHGKR